MAMKNLSCAFLLFLFSLAATAQDSLSYRELLDLSYRSAEATTFDCLQRLHLLVPQLPESSECPPLLVWIGGGAWSFTDRNQELNLARQFARQGIAVAVVGHRLSRGRFSDKQHAGGVQHPAHIQDVAAAFRWLYDRAGDYGYDRQNIFVGGYSSGAHLTALLGLDPQYLAAEGLELSVIRGLLPVSGTYDIVDYHRVFAEHERPASREMATTHVKDVFGSDESLFPAASPVTYLDNLRAPLLLISDRGVYKYTRLLEDRLRETEFQNYQVLKVVDHNHGGLWRDLSQSKESVARSAMLSFIRRHRLVEG